MSWTAEYRAPDGQWLPLATGADVRQVIRQLRRWRGDQGHLAPETRVRLGREAIEVRGHE